MLLLQSVHAVSSTHIGYKVQFFTLGRSKSKVCLSLDIFCLLYISIHTVNTTRYTIQPNTIQSNKNRNSNINTKIHIGIYTYLVQVYTYDYIPIHDIIYTLFYYKADTHYKKICIFSIFFALFCSFNELSALLLLLSIQCLMQQFFCCCCCCWCFRYFV